MQLPTIAVLLVSVAVSASAQTISITACGQTVPAGMTGVLANDLTCTADETFGVAVERRGTLDLAGHTLSGGERGVRCADRCAVVSTGGAGTISGSGYAGVSVVARQSRVKLANLGIATNATFAVLTSLSGGHVDGEQVTLTGNSIAIQANVARFSGLTASGNFTVFQAKQTTLENSTLSGNSNYGITGLGARLRNSSVTGSGSGIDILTQRRPRLFDSTCDVSRDLGNPTQTWGVCTND
jgi:hypothetical protein